MESAAVDEISRPVPVEKGAGREWFNRLPVIAS